MIAVFFVGCPGLDQVSGRVVITWSKIALDCTDFERKVPESMSIPAGDQVLDPQLPPRDLERELKELEILVKKQELRAKEQEANQKKHWLALLNNPFVLAVLAALIGYISTLITWFLSREGENERHKQTLALEETKQKGTLILDALKTGTGSEKTSQAAANLLLLADAQLLNFDPAIREKLEKWRGSASPGLPSPVPSANSDRLDAVSHARVRSDVEYATKVLNTLFQRNVTPPEVRQTEFGMLNAYLNLETKTVHVSPAVRHIPDITYRQVAHLFHPDWEYEGESGALVTSVSDVLAFIVRQQGRNQTAQTADWGLYQGGVAWLRGDDPSASRDSTPLVSLKAPGTAYDDPVVGKDPQVDHMSEYVKMVEDNGGVHIYSGIPNKAFYEAAMKLGMETAMSVWVKAISNTPPPRPTFAAFARETVKQAEAVKGKEGRDALIAVWSVVGVEPAN